MIFHEAGFIENLDLTDKPDLLAEALAKKNNSHKAQKTNPVYTVIRRCIKMFPNTNFTQHLKFHKGDMIFYRNDYIPSKHDNTNDTPIENALDMLKKFGSYCNKALMNAGLEYELVMKDSNLQIQPIKGPKGKLTESAVELPKMTGALNGHVSGAYTRSEEDNIRAPYIPDTSLPQGTGRKIGTNVMTDESVQPSSSERFSLAECTAIPEEDNWRDG